MHVPRWCFKNCEKTELKLRGFSGLRLISSVYEALKGELELQSSVCYTDSQVTCFRSWVRTRSGNLLLKVE